MIRLTLLIILFLISLLTIFKAPTNLLWMVAIVAAEYGWILIFLTGILMIWGFQAAPVKSAGTIIGFLTLILYLSPIVRAAIVSGKLKEELYLSLNMDGKELPGQNPFSFFKLFTFNKKVPFETLTYQQGIDKDYVLDYYQSSQAGKRPCVVVIHGGSWSSGDSRQLPELNSYLAIKGFNVASITYHLAPAFTSPQPVMDVAKAISFLKTNSEKLKIDTTNFVLLGRSAGAQIALMAAYTLNDRAIKGVVDIYGPADMVWGYFLPTNPLVMDSKKVMEDYLGGKYDDVPENYANSSAVEFVNKNTTPTLMIHGAKDVLVAYEHSKRLEEKLAGSGVKHYWLKLPWATHGFDYNLRGPGGQLSTYAIEAFINNVTGR